MQKSIPMWLSPLTLYDNKFQQNFAKTIDTSGLKEIGIYCNFLLHVNDFA